MYEPVYDILDAIVGPPDSAAYGELVLYVDAADTQQSLVFIKVLLNAK